MAKVRTGYFANIAGGMLLGFLVTGIFAGGVFSALSFWLGMATLVYYFVIAGIGAIVGGACGGIWAFRNRRILQNVGREAAKTR